MNEKRATRILQKYVNAISICDEKEIRSSKRFRDATRIFEMWEQKKAEKNSILKESLNNRKTNETIILDLKEIRCSQEIEIIRLRQQLKTLMKKYTAQESCLAGDQFTIYGVDREIAYKKRLLLNILKLSSNMYLGETNPVGIIAGFVCNATEEAIIPFEFGPKKSSDSKIIDGLFKMIDESSPFSDNWEHIFSK